MKTRIALLIALIGASHFFPVVGRAAEERAEVVTEGGELWTWGGNAFGQLGHRKGKYWPLTGGRYEPVAIKEVGEATEIAAGFFHSICIDDTGAVWTCGADRRPSVGVGLLLRSGRFRRVPELQDAIAIAGGQYFSVAVLKDGTLRAWGSNQSGQLGDGTTKEKASPVGVLGIDNAHAVAAGRNFTIALKQDGTVWGWGYNGYGQLGDGTTEDRLRPVRMGALEEVKAIACGDFTTMALKEDGTVWACGYNWYGNLGDGTQMHRSSPVRVKDLENVVIIASGSNHSLALTTDGAVWAWGNGLRGELGLGEDETSARGSGPKRSIATRIPGLQDIRAVAAGMGHSLAVDNDGILWAWGRNPNGQFGINEPGESLVPVKISTLSAIEKIACGIHHSLVIRSTPSKND